MNLHKNKEAYELRSYASLNAYTLCALYINKGLLSKLSIFCNTLSCTTNHYYSRGKCFLNNHEEGFLLAIYRGEAEAFF